MKSKINVQEFERMYYTGVSPSDIAKSMSVEYKVMCGWMHAHHYPALCPALEDVALEMYTNGATDLEIAMSIDRGISTVVMWRKRHGLKKNRIKRNTGRPILGV